MICPRCGGRQIVTRDTYGNFAECIMCGNETQLDQNGRPSTPIPWGSNDHRTFATAKWRRGLLRDDVR